MITRPQLRRLHSAGQIMMYLVLETLGSWCKSTNLSVSLRNMFRHIRLTSNQRWMLLISSHIQTVQSQETSNFQFGEHPQTGPSSRTHTQYLDLDLGLFLLTSRHLKLKLLGLFLRSFCSMQYTLSWSVSLLWLIAGESCIHMNARIQGFPTDFCPLSRIILFLTMSGFNVGTDLCLQGWGFKQTALSKTFLCFISTQLHQSSDTSESGYGAETYLSFMTGKANVEWVIIPRLELSAAVLAVGMERMSATSWNFLCVRVSVFWLDSASVLRYSRN